MVRVRIRTKLTTAIIHSFRQRNRKRSFRQNRIQFPLSTYPNTTLCTSQHIMSDELSYSSHSTANQRLMSDELSYTSNMSPDEELVKAAKWGDFKRVKDAIENGAEVDTYLELSSFPDFFPALSWACHNGDVKIAKYLKRRCRSQHS